MSTPELRNMMNYVVKASAGTGKTSRLVDQYLVLLGLAPVNEAKKGQELVRLGGDQCRPEEIVAVTFTRKAADELKDRLSKALVQQGYAEADMVEGSFIGTVHGVCLRILQEYALEAGISPVAEELAEDDAQVMFQQAVAPIMEKYADLRRLFSDFGLEPRSFRGGKTRKKEDSLLAFCRDLVSLARSNGKTSEDLRAYGAASWAELETQLDALAASLDETPTLESLQAELEEAWREQKEEANYSHEGQVNKEEKALGITKLSILEKAHLALVRSLPLYHMRWKNWLRLIGREGGTKGNLPEFVHTIEEIGRKVFALPGFRRDAKILITQMFDFAAEAMECFSIHKQSAGVVDFADMELMACKALENNAVRERLRGRFRVLFVDEFQDTSPIQLRIFQLLRGLLSSTDDRPGCTIFVGDDKQSIYGFRGAASELTRSCTPAPLWKSISLDTCYRSLPDICAFTNSYFSSILDEGGIRSQLLDGADALNVESYLDLEQFAQKKAALGNSVPALHFWLTGRTKGRLTKQEQLDSLARNVAFMCGRLDRNGDLVPMKGNRTSYCIPAKIDGKVCTREVRPGDIAILCRSNKDCMGIASALESLGIRACVERDGLLDHPAVRFSLAACRLALDLGNRFSAAELHKAVYGGEKWFEAAEDDARNDAIWREARDKKDKTQDKNELPALRLTSELPFFGLLEQIHSRLALLSPSEFLDLVLDAVDAFRRAATAPHPDEHLANLERLRTLVREYEKAMHSRRSSASVQGWLDWLEEYDPGQASGGEDAVQIWTYHKSKGLARSVIILFSLDKGPKSDDIWKVKVKDLSPDCPDPVERDSRNPLEGRELRWWPNIFQKAIEFSEVKDFFDEAKDEARDKARAEALRLLYVGMTRAADILVLTGGRTTGGELSAAWLTEFFIGEYEDKKGKKKKGVGPEFNDITTTPEKKSTSTRKKKGEPAEENPEDEHPDPQAESWDGRSAILLGCPFRVRLNLNMHMKSLPKELHTTGEAEARYPKSRGRAEKNAVDQEKQAIPGTMRHPGSAVAVNSEASRRELGNMIHAWLNLAFIAPSSGEEQARRLDSFCRLWNSGTGVWPEAVAHLPELTRRLDDFIHSLLKTDEEAVFLTEWPLVIKEEQPNGVLLSERRLDLLVEVRSKGRPVRWIVIDHKCGDYSASKNDSDLSRHLTDNYGSQMGTYLRAMQSLGRPCDCWVHLPLEGKMLEFHLPEQGE